MNYSVFLAYGFIDSIVIFFAFTNIYMYQLKKTGKIFLYAYIFTCILLLYPKFGQSVVYVLLIGSAVIVVFYSERTQVLQNVSFTLSGYLIYVIMDYALSFIIYFLGYSPNDFSKRYPIFMGLIVGLATYTITYSIGKLLQKKFIGYSFPKELSIFLLAELTVCTGIYTFNIVYGEKYSYPQRIMYFNGVLFLTFFFVTMVTFFFIMRIMKKMYVLQAQKKEAEQLKEYTEKLEVINQEMRMFRHDYMNILATINGYLINGDLSELKIYFENRIFPKGHILSENDILISHLSNMEIPEVKGILYSKLTNALNSNLEVTLEIQEKIEQINMDILDIATVLGIFLDNAIEAAGKSRRKLFVIIFIKSDDYVDIIIENSTDAEADLNAIRKESYTTKNNHEGVGLYKADEILNHYGNVLHTTGCQDNIFRQSLRIVNINKRGGSI